MMSSSNYMKRLGPWMARLAENNNREWFKAHRAEFDALREPFLADLDKLGALLMHEMPELGLQRAADAVYRIYRDTRFSKDKTPYKTFFSASWSPGGHKGCRAGWYLHVDPLRPDESGIFGGLWQPPGPDLRKLRHAIVDNIEEWDEIMARASALGLEPWTSGMLKTAPQGWPKDHPAIKWLRMKDYGLWRRVDAAEWERPDWTGHIARLAAGMTPFIRFINYSLDEEAPFTLP